eukprot:31882-Prorocentrum_minimum.AAC.1
MERVAVSLVAREEVPEAKVEVRLAVEPEVGGDGDGEGSDDSDEDDGAEAPTYAGTGECLRGEGEEEGAERAVAFDGEIEAPRE